MTYLITQTFVLLLIAGLLGLLLGWYLTRLSGAHAQAALQSRVRKAEEQQRKMREERDAAVTARDSAENERRLQTDELNRLRALHDGDSSEVGRLEAELAACRESLEEAGQPTVPDDYEALKSELDSCREALSSALEPAAAAAEQEADSTAIASAAAAAASGALGLMGDAAAASAASAADDEPDDLQQISGIGPKIAGILRELGVQRFEQIAAWTPEEVERINAKLRFKGRIEREAWIPQAKALLESLGRA